MKLELTKGYCTEVDEEDFEWASQWKWYVIKHHTGVYAARSEKVSGKWRTLYFHRALWVHLGNTLEHQIDHINRYSLDNRRCNLREATRSQNAQNKQSKGYGYDKSRNKWYAQIAVNGSDSKFIGRFNTEEEAAAAVKTWRLKLHGDFACV